MDVWTDFGLGLGTGYTSEYPVVVNLLKISTLIPILGPALTANNMDPATAVGIALSGISLAFDIFHGCVVGFQLLSAAHNLGNDAEFLVCMLRLEEYRLILWAKRSGLADDDLDRKFDDTAIRTTLAKLKELLTDAEKLKKRYKLDLRDSNVEACPIKLRKSSSAVSQFLSNNAIETAQEKILQRAKAELKMNWLHKRLWWAAVDRKGFEELIVHIGSLIQRLFDFLSLASREEMRESLHLVHLSLLSIIEKVDDIIFATQDIKGAVVPDETLQTVAALRRLQINLSDLETSGFTRQDSPLAHKRVFREMTAGVQRTTAFYEDVPVYVERKKYAVADIDGANAVKITKRVDDLSKFLHVPKAPSFQSLHCIGYFQDATNSEYVFVFDRPLTAHDITLPISLSSLLRSKHIPSQLIDFGWPPDAFACQRLAAQRTSAAEYFVLCQV
jgi:hypothetical protein